MGGMGRAPRLPKEKRRRQLLDVARSIVREEGADKLTLIRLAARAGVSKPVAYEHFGDRSGLLIELYRWIDTERVDAFREALVSRNPTAEEAVAELAAAYIDCAADTTDEFHAVGAALAGSAAKAAVFQELLDHSVRMFVVVLRPHSTVADAELQRRCLALVGAGEALSSALVRGVCPRPEATATFAAMIGSALRMPSR